MYRTHALPPCVPLPLKRNGPQFSIDLFSQMFGHPGFSALEFGGGEPDLTPRKTLSLKGKSTYPTLTHDENIPPPPSSSAGNSELQLPRSPLQELSTQQRRRGTFINHTPRAFEVRSPKRLDPPTADEVFGTARDSVQDHSQGSKKSSWSQPWQQEPPKPWAVEDFMDVYGDGPQELDSKEVNPATFDKIDSKTQTSNHDSVTSPLSSTVVFGSPLYPSTGEVVAAGSDEPPPETKKRRRRQTPYKIPIYSRHSPLEPWIAQHQRQASQVTESPPRVNFTHVGAMSTSRAIQEYFDTQTQHQLEGSAILQLKCRPTNALGSTPQDKQQPCQLESPFEPTAVFPIDGPSIPQHDHSNNTHDKMNPRNRSQSLSSQNSNFDSEAQGQYSPYDKKHIKSLILSKQCRESEESFGPAARAGFPFIGRMAPPILGHEALTASTVLNDLSHWLKNTGPSAPPESSKRHQKKGSFKMFKVRNKNHLSARAERPLSSHRTSRARPPIISSYTEERTTSRGTKHLRIVIPSSENAAPYISINHRSKQTPDRRSRHLSITFTEEMLNPLGSHAVESVIAKSAVPYNDEEQTASPTGSARAKKKDPVPAKRETVNESAHPLASREERARARKIRDLHRHRRMTGSVGGGSVDLSKTTPTMPSTPAQSPSRKPIPPSMASSPTPMSPPPHSPFPSFSQDDLKTPNTITNPNDNDNDDDTIAGAQIDNSNETHLIDHNDKDSLAIPEIRLLKLRVITLQRLNTELTSALAGIVGFEAENGDLDAEAVLGAFRRCKMGPGNVGGVREGRRGRVFTA